MTNPANMDFRKVLGTLTTLQGASSTKKKTLNEDIHVQADGQEAMSLLNILKLAGMDAPAPAPAISIATDSPGPIDSPIRGDATDGPSLPPLDGTSIQSDGPTMELEVESEGDFANTPNERIAPLDAVLPSGTDMHRSKKSFSPRAGGDNPMVNTLEAKLLKQFYDFINEGSQLAEISDKTKKSYIEKAKTSKNQANGYLNSTSKPKAERGSNKSEPDWDRIAKAANTVGKREKGLAMAKKKA